ncbi:hypothetical protein [Pseudomonas vranovensis]|uniref:hypothetical protein n=1 Tax=Pseudomonas vranovensis TaxID=321661 RepID=UPI003D988127
MNSNFYLPRKLSNNNDLFTEEALLTASNYVVILAEPGAGKTALMESIAQKLDTVVLTANRFKHSPLRNENSPLVIDAFDELAKVDPSGIYTLLSKAESSKPTHIYLSSRSSEWGNSNNVTFKEFFGCTPLIARLCEFTESEQKLIFENYSPEESFLNFRSEVSRFDLQELLPNPQFLKLFADAYTESNRQFPDKKSIFSLAVERLAKEVNPGTTRTTNTFSTIKKIDLSSEVFAKLLLAGSDGVCTSESTEERMYPALDALFINQEPNSNILATRLFRPGDCVDHHRPVHKIVAEYCAADYLIKRIVDPSDSLNLAKCLPIIAPNSAVRDELRGLLGWMASLGDKPTQEKIIELDPYAVLANGDPSQLLNSSKRLLVSKLVEIETVDPYFRRNDFWRRFSVAGFFTKETIEEVRPLLKTKSGGHLRNLILELLIGSSAANLLREELRHLLLTPEESQSTRILAMRCLLEISDYDHFENLRVLTSEATNISLTLSAKIIEKLLPSSITPYHIASFLRVCAQLYPDTEYRERTIGSRYFVKDLISKFSPETTETLLDTLTEGLVCICRKKSFECRCRNGLSKIIGSLLDRYFELFDSPFDAIRIWSWVKNLKFNNQHGANESIAVSTLQENLRLRYEIIAHVFSILTDKEEIFQTQLHHFNLYSHSGLILTANDHKFIIDLAFSIDNPQLWISFIAHHKLYRTGSDRGPNDLRSHMREQANIKPALMREWAKSNRAAIHHAREHNTSRFLHSRKFKRRKNREKNIHAQNIEYIKSHRALIESGRHWSLLVRFAELTLMQPNRISEEFEDDALVRRSLRSCFGFISSIVPTLEELSELHGASKYNQSEVILYAACLETLRDQGNLKNIEYGLLQSLRAGLDMHYSSVSSEERDALKAEVDRLLFSETESAEYFLRKYVEPQLSPQFSRAKVWLLKHDEPFSSLRHKLSLEWLKKYCDIALEPLEALFEIAIEKASPDELNDLILQRCSGLMSENIITVDSQETIQRRTFWLLRAWYFLENPPEEYWDWLQSDKNIVHSFSNRSGNMSRHDNRHWPKLNSIKIEKILVAFIEQWPKVHLPTQWGTDSPAEEKAYRFLSEISWSISSDSPARAIPVLNRLLSDERFIDARPDLKSIHAAQIRKKSLEAFDPPSTRDIVNRLDRDSIVTVEGLRQLIIQELQEYQKYIFGGEYNSADRFYNNGARLGEESCTEIIAERLSLILRHQNIIITPEHHLKSEKRSDFTVAKIINGKRRLLVTEVKGQWHRELYNAASTQLYERYSIHPEAEEQGIYLILWFGETELVADRKGHNITCAQVLKNSVEESLPQDLKGLIDIFVLDLSKKQHN